MAEPTSPVKEWRRTTSDDEYLISTQPSLLDRDFLNTAFATDDMYWAKPLPAAQLETLLAHSQSLGLYHLQPSSPSNPPDHRHPDSPSSPRTPSPTTSPVPSPSNLDGDDDHQQRQRQQIGYARLVTDFVTTAYLTDVYVSPRWRGKGLAVWLMGCCRELIETLPAARRAFLVASPGVGTAFYERQLGFHDAVDERQRLVVMTRRFFELDGH